MDERQYYCRLHFVLIVQKYYGHLAVNCVNSYQISVKAKSQQKQADKKKGVKLAKN